MRTWPGQMRHIPGVWSLTVNQQPWQAGVLLLIICPAIQFSNSVALSVILKRVKICSNSTYIDNFIDSKTLQKNVWAMFTSSKFCTHLKNHAQVGMELTSGVHVALFPAHLWGHKCLINLEGLQWWRPVKFPKSVTSSKRENSPFFHCSIVLHLKMQDDVLTSSLPLPQTNIWHLKFHFESKPFFLLMDHKTYMEESHHSYTILSVMLTFF